MLSDSKYMCPNGYRVIMVPQSTMYSTLISDLHEEMSFCPDLTLAFGIFESCRDKTKPLCTIEKIRAHGDSR